MAHFNDEENERLLTSARCPGIVLLIGVGILLLVRIPPAVFWPHGMLATHTNFIDLIVLGAFASVSDKSAQGKARMWLILLVAAGVPAELSLVDPTTVWIAITGMCLCVLFAAIWTAKTTKPKTTGPDA